MRPSGALLAAALLGLGLGACEDELQPPIIRTLEGPTDIAFACRGLMRLTGGGEATPEQDIITTPMPVDACRAWNEVGTRLDKGEDEDDEDDDRLFLVGMPPAGQGPLDLVPGQRLRSDELEELFEEWQQKIEFYAFVLQENSGTVALVRQTLGASGIAVLEDADPFAPGLNVIPVGPRPVGIATDPAGCHVTVANAGSCDLSAFEVAPVVSGESVPVVRRMPVQNAAGEILSAEPRAMVGQAGNPPLGFECPDSPDSLVYVAYPDCNAVAAVHAATGEIRASIVFAEDGSAVVGDGNLTCAAATCGGLTTPPVVEIPDAGVSDASVPDAGAPDAGAPDAGVAVAAVGGRPRPTSLHMATDGGRLYIGAENSPRVTVVELDAAAVPTATWSVTLEGEVGVTALAATDLIAIGGESGHLDEAPAGSDANFRFVYAAATDGTVRVAEVHGQRRECDTQIDPRYLHDVDDPKGLACLPVDDQDALQRRVGARSPGIHMPADARPLDITIARTPGLKADDPDRPKVLPTTVIGTFAFISLSNGTVVVANIDDDNYGDVESQAVPAEVDLSLAMPHQLRDGGNNRRTTRFCREQKPDLNENGMPDAEEDLNGNGDLDIEEDLDGNGIVEGEEDRDGDGTPDLEEDNFKTVVCDSFDVTTTAQGCDFPAGAVQGLPTITSASQITLAPGYVAESYAGALPKLRSVECNTPFIPAVPATDSTPEIPAVEAKTVAVPELSIMAPDPLRELLFPDLQGLGTTETWNIVWEGALSRQDQAGLDATVRVGYLDFEAGVALHDGASLFCEMGVQPGDVVALVGCDPTLGNGNCRTGEVCAVIPEVALDEQSGICVPEGREREFLDTCSSFLSSRRRFTVAEAFADGLVLAERKRILRTTPTDGCTSAEQCAGLYELEQQLADNAENPPPLAATSPASTDLWACEPDPVRAPDRNVCLMTCAGDDDCETGEGWRCSDEGYCVEAKLPPAECVESQQRYQVRAGDVFTVIGSQRGFLHDRIADPMTRECVADPSASDLAVGRLPMTALPCPGDGSLDFTTLAPNPCATTVGQFEVIEDEEGEEDPEPVERQAAAIRFRNPAFAFHVVDPVLDPVNQGIACTLDGAPCPPMRFVPPDYAITFTIGAGFLPFFALTDLRYPIGMALDPLGSIWVLDQGDVAASTRGQVAKVRALTLEYTTLLY